MKRIISLLLVLMTLAGVFSGCSESGSGEGKLKIYCTEAQAESYKNIFKYYNEYCLINQSFGPDYQVEFVTFADDVELYRKASTEIMAGGGPDVFFTEQILPFEKMIGAGTFADIDESAKREGVSFDFSDCNANVMDSGVWNGKRYIVPVVYSARFMSSDKSQLNEAGLKKKNGDVVTYTDLLTPMSRGVKHLGYDINTELLTNRLIYDCVDMKSKSVSFGKEFIEGLRVMKKLYEYEQKNGEVDIEGNPYLEYMEYINPTKRLFTNAQNSFSNAVVDLACSYRETAVDFYYDKKVAESKVVLRGVSLESDDDSGFIDFGIAVNRNTKRMKKALEFIKYSVSKTGQSHITSPYSSYAYGNSFPVNKTVFKKRIKNAREYKDFEQKECAMDSEVMREYVRIAENVGECRLYGGSSYYTENIAGKLINKYLRDELSENKLIRQLSSATKFYLEE